ncbi:hypothetical protein SCALM49S_06302 [Streptomyces californicus]
MKANWEPFFSSERRAFWRASVKFRPIAGASPTDFMVVVQGGVGGGELLEGEARGLDDDVQGRVRGGVDPVMPSTPRAQPPVGALRAAAGGLGAGAEERETRMRADPAVGGVDGELDVAAAGVDADLADDRDTDVAGALMPRSIAATVNFFVPMAGTTYASLAVGARKARPSSRTSTAGVRAPRVEIIIVRCLPSWWCRRVRWRPGRRRAG